MQVITRRIDKLGRIVLPMDYRKALGLFQNQRSSYVLKVMLSRSKAQTLLANCVDLTLKFPRASGSAPSA